MTQKDPILINTPNEIITNRLILRPMMPGDGTIMFDAIMESIDVFKEWFEWAHNIKFPDDCEKTARLFYAKFILREQLTFLAFEKDANHQAGQLVGCCGLQDICWDMKTASIGYWVRQSCHGQGYAKEMLDAMTEIGCHKLGFHRLSIFIDDKNPQSIRVAEKCGYDLEITARGIGCMKPGDPDLRPVRCYVWFNDMK